MPGERAGSYRGSHSPLLLCPITEPNDAGSRLGIKGSACEVVGGACLQQNHRAAINPCVLWRNWREEENKIGSGCSQRCSLLSVDQYHPSPVYNRSTQCCRRGFTQPPSLLGLLVTLLQLLLLSDAVDTSITQGVCFRWRQHPGEKRCFPHRIPSIYPAWNGQMGNSIHYSFGRLFSPQQLRLCCSSQTPLEATTACGEDSKPCLSPVLGSARHLL